MIAVVNRKNLATGLFVLAGCIVFLLWARTYSAQSRAMPELVAWVTIALTLIDIVIQFETAPSRWLRRLVTAEKIVEWKMEGEEEASVTKVVQAVAWVAGYVALLYFVGFLISTPIYVLLYMIFHGGHSIRNSVLMSIGTVLAIWLTFEVLFKYPLYPGSLFGGY
ncbi:MAG: tripartite tricarboxylate transporter TctB family protein [Xanthobacteraceae bacterium]